jgi:hypothetical protein
VLKFSTADDEFNGWRGRSGGQEQWIAEKRTINEVSRRAKMGMDFGGCFAYKDGAAHPGKSSDGEQYGEENPEEVEEDRSNEAVDDG